MDKVLKVNVYLNDIKDWAKDEYGLCGAVGQGAPCGLRLLQPAASPGIHWSKSISSRISDERDRARKGALQAAKHGAPE